MSSASLLSLPADCRLAIILAAASYSIADRITLRSFLLLCKDFCKLVLANWPQIVEHYTMKEVLFNQTWYLFCRQVHRNNDLPAITYASGTQYWYQYDKVHRDNDLPAIIFDGTQKWYQCGKLHRDNNLPAVIYSNGTQEWWYHGKRHRDNNLPAIIFDDGTQLWYRYGVFVRRQHH